jgi:hypothetical protein
VKVQPLLTVCCVVGDLGFLCDTFHLSILVLLVCHPESLFKTQLWHTDGSFPRVKEAGA